MQELYFLRVKPLWNQFWKEGFSFWMICGYLFFEYVRPHAIIPAIDILPWASVFLVLSLAGLFFDKERRWVSDPANKWMITFLVVLVFASYNAFRPQIAFERLEFFYTWLIIYFLIINIVNTKERFYIFFLLYCLASFKLSMHGAQVWTLRGFGFTSWGITGPPGFFQNSGELSIQMLCFFPIGYYLFLNLKDKVRIWEKVVLILFFVTPAMTILGASSRGSQLALLIQFFLMFYKQIFKPKIIISIVIVVYLATTYLPEEQKDRFRTMGDDRTSEQRLLYWENGLDMISDHPFLGVGFFNFPAYYEAHYSEDMLYENAELPHNIFIQVGTDAGIIGLLVYLALIFRFFRQPSITVEKDDPFYRAVHSGIVIGIIGYFVAGQFVTVAYYPFMWISLSMLVALQNIYRDQTRVR